MDDLNPSITGVTITEGTIEEIAFNYEPVIKLDRPSSNGNCRHLAIKTVDNKIKFNKSFVFNVSDVSQSEKDNLLALGGRNDVEFTLAGIVYICTCSTFDFESDKEGQIIDTVELTLRIRSINEAAGESFTFYDGSDFKFYDNSTFDFYST